MKRRISGASSRAASRSQGSWSTSACCLTIEDQDVEFTAKRRYQSVAFISKVVGPVFSHRHPSRMKRDSCRCPFVDGEMEILIGPPSWRRSTRYSRIQVSDIGRAVEILGVAQRLLQRLDQVVVGAVLGLVGLGPVPSVASRAARVKVVATVPPTLGFAVFDLDGLPAGNTASQV